MNHKPIILAVETSSRVGSVAVAFGRHIHKEIVFSGPMKHSAEIFPAISTLLEDIGRKPHQIDQLYLSNGPGSFTGLRIAATLAKAMHLAHQTKLITVDTLDVIASNMMDCLRAYRETTSSFGIGQSPFERIATVLDAKRGQFYIAVYQRLHRETDPPADRFDQYYKKIQSDTLMSASEFLTRFACSEDPIWLLGDGLVYHQETFQGQGVHLLDETYWSPRASNVHLLGWPMACREAFTDPILLTPFYLSRPGITLKTR